MEKNLAMVSIGLVCVTSPIIGVIIGGYITDKSGGVKNLEYCLWLGFILTFSVYIRFFFIILNKLRSYFL